MEMDDSVVTNSNQKNIPIKQIGSNESEEREEDNDKETLQTTLSTRSWAEKNDYDPKILLNKVREIQPFTCNGRNI